MSDRAHRQIASAGPPAPDHHGHVAAHVERRVHRELCTACCDRAVKVVCYALCTFYFILFFYRAMEQRMLHAACCGLV